MRCLRHTVVFALVDPLLSPSYSLVLLSILYCHYHIVLSCCSSCTVTIIFCLLAVALPSVDVFNTLIRIELSDPQCTSPTNNYIPRLPLFKEYKFHHFRSLPSPQSPTSPSRTSTQVVSIPENLSLLDNQRHLLSKEMNFVPLHPCVDKYTLLQDVDQFIRRAHLQLFRTQNTLEPAPNDELAFLSTLDRRNTQCTPLPGESKTLEL